MSDALPALYWRWIYYKKYGKSHYSLLSLIQSFVHSLLGQLFIGLYGRSLWLLFGQKLVTPCQSFKELSQGHSQPHGSRVANPSSGGGSCDPSWPTGLGSETSKNFWERGAVSIEENNKLEEANLVTTGGHLAKQRDGEKDVPSVWAPKSLLHFSIL